MPPSIQLAYIQNWTAPANRTFKDFSSKSKRLWAQPARSSRPHSSVSGSKSQVCQESLNSVLSVKAPAFSWGHPSRRTEHQGYNSGLGWKFPNTGTRHMYAWHSLCSCWALHKFTSALFFYPTESFPPAVLYSVPLQNKVFCYRLANLHFPVGLLIIHPNSYTAQLTSGLSCGLAFFPRNTYCCLQGHLALQEESWLV